MVVLMFAGHESRRVHLCTRCGWPFSNPHPSPKHRRSYKKHCGTIEGYTVLIGAEVVSDEDHHADTDKEKSPSTSGVLNAPIVVSKVDASLEVTEKPVTDAEKFGEAEITTLHDLSESKLELTETDEKCADGLVKDGAVDCTPEPIHVSQSQEAETIEAVKAAKEKVESQTSKIITKEAKDSEVTKTTPGVSLIVGQDDDDMKQEVCEKIESEAVKESEVNNDKIILDHEVAPEVVKESEIKLMVEGIVEEIQIKKIESDRELVPKEEFVNKLDTVLTEKSDVDALESVKYLDEHIQEVVKELVTVLNEKENSDAAEFVKFLKDQVHDAVKELETVVTE
ncbi:hypothetical protein Tco_0920910, partial [Tanacetum coccineum]